MRQINVGLIGYGVGGAVFHAPLIRSVPALRLLAVVSSRREEIERLPGVRAVHSVEALLADPAVELVAVASPTAAHYEAARLALLAGKHVIVDKPVCVTPSEADSLILLAERQRRILSVFQNRRWDGDFLTVKQCVENRWIGDIYYYEAHFDRFRPQPRAVWREQSGAGSGILYDLGSHLIDQAIQLFGMPRSVTADAFAQREGAEAVDYFHLVLEYGRLRAVLHGSMLVAKPGPRFTVHGDAGSFLKYGLDPQEQALRDGKMPGGAEWGLDDPACYGQLTPAGGATRSVPTIAGCYQRYYEQIAGAIANGGSTNPVKPEGARDGLRVIEAAMQSAEQRRTVAIL